MFVVLVVVGLAGLGLDFGVTELRNGATFPQALLRGPHCMTLLGMHIHWAP